LAEKTYYGDTFEAADENSLCFSNEEKNDIWNDRCYTCQKTLTGTYVLITRLEPVVRNLWGLNIRDVEVVGTAVPMPAETCK